MVTTHAVFIGDGSLLVQCTEAFRGLGHQVAGVVSASPANLDWARAAGIPALPMEGDWAERLQALHFDYLFSVANLRMLPPSVLQQARRLAVNFHDALLPRYAGLNATCWALMGGEAVHGITWHEMTERADAGRIVRQVSFEVSPQETALSLNAKCYEAGLAGFTQIAQDLTLGDLSLSPQQGERSYFGRHRRPALLGTLDFARPGRELAALVRALDFGTYANPLGRAKAHAGGRLLLVAGAAFTEGPCAAAPGTVLAADAGTLRVATVDGELLLTGCVGVDGRPADVAAGQSLAVPAAVAAALQQRLEAIARGEPHWTEALQQAAPVELPYPRRHAPGAEGPMAFALEAPVQGPATVAAVHAWLSMLTGQERVSVLYTDAALAEQAPAELSPWLGRWVPLTGTTASNASTADAIGAAELLLARTRAAGPMTRDLPLRLGDRHAPLAAVSRIALALAPCDAPEGCELLVRPAADGRRLELVLDGAAFAPDVGLALATQLDAFLQAFTAGPAPVAQVPLLPSAEQAALAAINATAVGFDAQGTVHQAICAQLQRQAEEVVVTCGGQTLTGAQLDEQSTALARRLVHRGVQPGDIVGLCVPRTPALLVAVLGIQKAGAAYLPLDPEYPRDRLQGMVEDSRAPVVIAGAATADLLRLAPGQLLRLDEAEAAPADTPLPAADASRPAYVIYTSGSTGKPKGVVVTHRNVMNFFAGMDQRVPHAPGSRWLAVTSLSFDISVLELYWTLARGVAVVLHSDAAEADAAAPASPQFSLFYFASDDSTDPRRHYQLLMEGAKFADREGFTAVWTPERHFHAFGGLYPNPVVTSAAVAAATTRVQIRAGSCVLPLHHPVRVAEDWAFVDNISNGRVGISFASGWQPNDFILMPDAFAKRQDEMIARMEVVRKLWRGEAVAFPGPHGNLVETRTLPRPVQQDIPVWITAAGNPRTFEQAGTLGCRLLTHLLGQKVEDVAEKIAIYRAAWRAAGHPGEGHVTLMLHTFVGQDEAATRETARGPMKKYLKSSVDLIKKAAWSFPTFVERGAASGKTPQEVMESAPLSDEEMDALLDHAFNRYYGTSALMGTQERCLELVRKVQGAGVDEIACLIDFGIEPATVIEHLQDLKALMEASRAPGRAAHGAPAARVSVADNVLRHGVTHLQCTPSMAAMLLADAPGRAALGKLQALMVGGEALPLEMARQLRALVPGALVNMYGPTETTVWSTTCNLATVGDFVPLGEPIANTQLSVRTPWGAECPALVPGELCIGGDGVTDGYLHRPELNAERFVADAQGHRWYRTGDLVRRLPDGAIEFLGRMDHQVKIRGHRIELGEIESVLMQQAGVKQAVVVAREDTAGQKFLAGYVTAKPGATLQAAALREAVAQALPEIMVPQAVLVLPALPMTPNGKVDRKVLPDPRLSAGAAQPAAAAAPVPAAAPLSAMETTIAGIWREVLGLESVGTTENFFDLGGHSLLVVQVQRRLREATGTEVAITDMFRLPTIRALAEHLGGGAASTAVSQGQSRAQQRRMLRSRQAA